MTGNSKDLGTMTTILERFTKQTLPKVLEIKKRANRSEVLNDRDINFLKLLPKRFNEVKPFVDRNPEYQELYAQAVHLYKDITKQALLNEKDTGK
jgi:hypothetical protein